MYNDQNALLKQHELSHIPEVTPDISIGDKLFLFQA